MIYPYSHKRATEFESSNDPATDKQKKYINRLSSNTDRLPAILESIRPGLTVDELTLGQAMFVIKCLKGEIKPLDECTIMEIAKIWNNQRE